MKEWWRRQREECIWRRACMQLEQMSVWSVILPVYSLCCPTLSARWSLLSVHFLLLFPISFSPRPFPLNSLLCPRLSLPGSLPSCCIWIRELLLCSWLFLPDSSSLHSYSCLSSLSSLPISFFFLRLMSTFLHLSLCMYSLSCCLLLSSVSCSAVSQFSAEGRKSLGIFCYTV